VSKAVIAAKRISAIHAPLFDIVAVTRSLDHVTAECNLHMMLPAYFRVTAGNNLKNIDKRRTWTYMLIIDVGVKYEAE
jgi:hypothetical protein